MSEWVQSAPTSGYDGVVPKVIQIRDVPDDVRDALAAAAEADGLSMNAYVRRELEHIAGRSRRARRNAAVVQDAQRDVAGHVDRATVLSVLHEGRGR